MMTASNNVPLPTDPELAQQMEQAMGDASPEALMEQSLVEDLSAEEPGESEASAASEHRSNDRHRHEELHHEVRRGRIAAIRGDDVFVELGGVDNRNQGVVPLTQFERPPRLGSIMDFVVQKVDEAQGLVFLSREGAVTLSTWDAMTKGSIVDARVTGHNKGGLELELVGGIRAFMPASQVDVHHVEDLSVMLGQKLEAMVQQIDRRARKVMLSRRRLLEFRREQAAAKLWGELEVGQEREGTVVRVTDFGAFVDLGGVDGLVHVSDLSHQRVDKPSDAVKVGQAVRVKVLKVQRDQDRISLGIKQIEPDPWATHGSTLAAGESVTGRVTKLMNFGAFVEVAPGVEGLLPVSELSWKRIGRPDQVVQEGQVVGVKVLEVDPERKRLTLSLKQVTHDPWSDAASQFARHSLVPGKVVRTTEFGAFVELTEGVEGLVHISELADRHVKRVEDVLNVGQSETFRVLEVDTEQRRVKLSLKAAKEPVAAPEPEQPRTPTKKRPPRESLKGGIGGGALGLGLRDLKL